MQTCCTHNETTVPSHADGSTGSSRSSTSSTSSIDQDFATPWLTHAPEPVQQPLGEGQLEARKAKCEGFTATTNLPPAPSSTSSPPDITMLPQRTGLTRRTPQWTPAYQPGDQVYIRLKDNDWHQGTVQSCTRTTAIARCPHLESEQPGSDFVEVPISRCATRAPSKATNARDMFNDIAQHASNNAHGGRRTRAGNG